MSEEFIYLDHAAATPMHKQVIRSMEPYFSEFFYNPSALYAPAVQVKQDYSLAKKKIAIMLGAKIGEITITAGATESINLAFFNFAMFNGEGHVVVPSIEHHAVLETAKLYENTIVPVNKKGIIEVEALKNAITDKTTLVSVAMANNELGTLQPIKKIAELISEIRTDRLNRQVNRPIYFHTDASQSASQLDMSVSRLNVDLMTLNAGKMYGPKQVGLLWVKSGLILKPQIVGGGQEKGLRSGTENVAGVIGFARALEIADEKRKSEVRRLEKLRNFMQSKLQEEFSEAIFSGDDKKRLASYLHVSFPGLDGERLVFRLESKGVLVATGSACAANYNRRSHVLEAIGLTAKEADGSLRITLGALSTEENITKATKIIIQEVKQEYTRISRK